MQNSLLPLTNKFVNFMSKQILAIMVMSVSSKMQKKYETLSVIFAVIF